MRLISLFVLLFSSHVAFAANLPGIPQFIDEMVERHHFKRADLERVFRRAEQRPDVIEAIEKPATLKPWAEYRANFVNPQRIKDGLKFWKKNEIFLNRAQQQFGVPAEYIVAIIGVETMYGKQTGRFRTLDALTTLAFDFPRRAPYFRAELEQYLLLASEQDFNLLAINSSYAGALGIPQFMPSNYRKYALDYNGNGHVDILHEPADAIGSVGNYFKHYGWRSGEPVTTQVRVAEGSDLGDMMVARPVMGWTTDAGVSFETEPKGVLPPAWLLDLTLENGKEYWLAFENFDVIMRYNISSYYAMSVHQLAQVMRASRP
ncbi:MAG: lytic murein transglycosylase B [Gammaproteobacteria bacterium]|nr:lytic murein transglycosylase B [Gammaproteobacteria bacterium]MBU1625074.1 lytic murein transglycosylase B [Gammaproteobacteria bacterium]MBU1981334.1 lytic murein transglycosylase B [Gammaproteobacteria bacterium]